MSSVVLGVTGGIAAYKTAEIASRLTKQGVEVYCIMTKNATEFITPLTLGSITNRPVAVDMFAEIVNYDIEHIALAKRADVFLIAPATANIIGKMAGGIADDMLSTTVMATKAPILLAPAMNTGMWENKAVGRNVEYLKSIGVIVIGPETGRMACGDIGLGRMSPPEQIAAEVMRFLNKSARLDYAGKKVLVTAGPTCEMLDPVRYITNRSSGKMGYETAACAAARGADVTLITGPVTIAPPYGVKTIRIMTAMELRENVMNLLPEQDVIIQAAAVADFRPEQAERRKIKKSEGLTITLIKNPDIAAEVGRMKKPQQIAVAFAAETNDAIENARVKRKSKNADIIVVNDITAEGAGFDVDTNIVTIITAQGETALPLMSKHDVANALLDTIAKMLP